MSKYALSLGLILLMTACLKETESELERAIERDNAIMENYINSNNIDATKTQQGFYYRKINEEPGGPQFVNGDHVGIYYEIKTIDGHLIDSHLDESKEPVIFKISNEGIWPIVLGHAALLAREGEELMVYSPSYLAFGNYSYQQLILAASNLVIKVKYVKKYSESELRAREEEMIQQYIEENELEGFELIDTGIYARTVAAGDDSKSLSKTGSNVSFNFKLYELGASAVTFESTTATRPTVSVGNSPLEFLNKSLNGVYPDEKIEVIATSFASYDGSIQIVPKVIRKDLVDKGEQIDLVKPFTPIFFEAEIVSVQ
ncbi:FKBP-type peptidyl-prolyl cis-trans isomerase [Negadavirga shengliensis]|uniref:Peptidyl-prolyl cis-trans isomerase n=1 Tax=Negadavirga shengliensis TaxID=1389218 RepID=A0ABV9SXQ6_9BACT